jgi:hypothetical protein
VAPIASASEVCERRTQYAERGYCSLLFYRRVTCVCFSTSNFLGALVSNITIDTSAAATDTIDYVATDSAGNTATSTRTVVVEAATSTTQ